MGLVRTLLVILLVYYGLKVLYRLFFPAFIKYAAKKAERQFQEKHTPQNSAKEGEISITKYPPKTANPNKKVGEYIDFEEIDEQK